MAVIERGIINAGLRIKKRTPYPTFDATSWTVVGDRGEDVTIALSDAALRAMNPEHLRDLVVEKLVYAVSNV